MENLVEDILRRNNLSVTDSRKKILHLFLSTMGGALAHGDIERGAGEKFDRVTVYRTLQTFVEKGIIHTIPTTDSSIRYALCKDDCTEGHHHDNHVHFICIKCGSTVCLEDTFIPEIKVPKGYSVNLTEVVVKGVCKNCRQ